MPRESHGGTTEHSFLEEMYHAGQNSKLKLMDGRKRFLGASIANEVEAKEWVAKVLPNFNDFYRRGESFIHTEMFIMSARSSGYNYDKAAFLKKGINLPIFKVMKDQSGRESKQESGTTYTNIPLYSNFEDK